MQRAGTEFRWIIRPPRDPRKAAVPKKLKPPALTSPSYGCAGRSRPSQRTDRPDHRFLQRNPRKSVIIGRDRCRQWRRRRREAEEEMTLHIEDAGDR
jgi:hypothetical protein